MKKRLLNTIIASSLAMTSLVGFAIAYYFNEAEEKVIPISLSDNTSDATFVISDIVEDDTYKLNPDHTSKSYSYTLSVNKSESSTYTQDVLVGSLTVSIKTKSQKLVELLSVTNVIDYTNPSNTENPDTIFSTTKDLNTMTLTKPTSSDSSGYYVFTNTMFAPISVINGNKVKLTLSVGDTLTDDDFVALNAAPYEIDVTLSEASNYVYAYIGGLNVSGTNVWESSDFNMMVPNIYASSWQWMWKADKDYASSAIKGFKHESTEKTNYSSGIQNVLDSTLFDSDGNYKVDVKKGDSIYWDGFDQSELIYVKAS